MQIVGAEGRRGLTADLFAARATHRHKHQRDLRASPSAPVPPPSDLHWSTLLGPPHSNSRAQRSARASRPAGEVRGRQSCTFTTCADAALHTTRPRQRLDLPTDPALRLVRRLLCRSPCANAATATTSLSVRSRSRWCRAARSCSSKPRRPGLDRRSFLIARRATQLLSLTPPSLELWGSWWAGARREAVPRCGDPTTSPTSRRPLPSGLESRRSPCPPSTVTSRCMAAVQPWRHRRCDHSDSQCRTNWESDSRRAKSDSRGSYFLQLSLAIMPPRSRVTSVSLSLSCPFLSLPLAKEIFIGPFLPMGRPSPA